MESGWERQYEVGIRSTKLLGAIAAASVIGLGAVMAATNPSQAAYEAYATQQFITRIDQSVCAKAPAAFGLRNECKVTLKSNRAQIRQFIADGTHHRNFIFFSIYTTDLSVASFLPSYRVETVGAFDQFRIYDAMQE